ncbi:MAG: hypothetical protein LAO55_07380 [Acidobacteriia bacterium]|nr:hypothetical protein [Terriglobia bacterium]
MRLASSLALFACLSAQAQVVPRVGAVVPGVGVGAGSLWRGNLGGILGQQPSRVTMDDLGRFDQYLAGAGAYCAALTAADYAANRLMVRSMAAYVRTMNAYSINPGMRSYLGRISTRISAFPCAWAGGQAEPLAFDPVPPPVNTEPPFSLTPPDVPNVAAADKETFSDLRARYSVDATKAASAWKSAALMNARLAAQGASLNADTAATVARFQLLFGLAAGSMLDHRWDEVTEHLQAVEQETAKVTKVVGR